MQVLEGSGNIVSPNPIGGPARSATESFHEKHDWPRLVAVTATILFLFFYTRACPFPSGMYWDLLTGRDFPAPNAWLLTPEKLSFLIAQSSASLLGLKAFFHAVFFLICGLLTLLAFRGPEPLPGIILLGLFAFSIQPLLSLRDMLLMLIIGMLLVGFESSRFKDSFGIFLIPITASAAVLGLPAWLIPALVLFQIWWGDECNPVCFLCSLFGLVIFLDPSLSGVIGSESFSHIFQHPDDLKLLSMLSAIFLIPNLVALPLLFDFQLPNLAFYCLVGFVALANPAYFPVFIMIGAVLLLSVLAQIPPLSLNANLIGVTMLVIILHLFLFLNPFGFRLNPSVRNDLGASLGLLLTDQSKNRRVNTHEIGELAWKGLISLNEEDIPRLSQRQAFWISGSSGKFDLEDRPSPDEPEPVPGNEAPMPGGSIDSTENEEFKDSAKPPDAKMPQNDASFETGTLPESESTASPPVDDSGEVDISEK